MPFHLGSFLSHHDDVHLSQHDNVEFHHRGNVPLRHLGDVSSLRRPSSASFLSTADVPTCRHASRPAPGNDHDASTLMHHGQRRRLSTPQAATFLDSGLTGASRSSVGFPRVHFPSCFGDDYECTGDCTRTIKEKPDPGNCKPGCAQEIHDDSGKNGSHTWRRCVPKEDCEVNASSKSGSQTGSASLPSGGSSQTGAKKTGDDGASSTTGAKKKKPCMEKCDTGKCCYWQASALPGGQDKMKCKTGKPAKAGKDMAC